MSVLDGVVHAEGPHAPLPFRSVLVHPFVLAALLVSALSIGLVWLLGSSNPFTPAGYVGYLTKGAVFGQSRFYGIQRGPDLARAHLAARDDQHQHHAVHLLGGLHA